MNSKTYINRIADEFGGLRKNDLLEKLKRLRSMIINEPLEIKVREKTEIESISEFKQLIQKKLVVKRLDPEERIEIAQYLQPKKELTIEDVLKANKVIYEKCMQIIDLVRETGKEQNINIFFSDNDPEGLLFKQFMSIADVNSNIKFDENSQNFKVLKNGDQ
ncbi:MAG: hypothetical protein ACFFC1_12595 [Promethearchaeota archaeon]